jgi:hypothetical protein
LLSEIIASIIVIVEAILASILTSTITTANINIKGVLASVYSPGVSLINHMILSIFKDKFRLPENYLVRS